MNLKDKRVLVTGGDGFIGSHLCETLVGNCAHLKATVLYNSFNHHGWLENVSSKQEMEICAGDIRDSDFCNQIMKDVDVVFHLAALIAIPYSYNAPSSYVQTNVQGTLNLLQAARTQGVDRFLQTSTSEVYGTARTVPIHESHPLQAQSPYSASKIASDALAFSFYSSFELPVVIVRPFNTFGPRQSARAFIPTVISQVAVGIKEIKTGNLSPTRDFNYVKDTCKGFVEIARSEKVLGETINIGSGKEISMEDLLHLILDLMNAEDVKTSLDPQRVRPQKSEVERLLADSSRLVELTGFSPDYGLKDGLSETIEWFLNEENLKQYKAGQYNV